jgi:hypothetical protein
MLRLLTLIVILALIIYYGAVFLQVFGVIKFTYEPIQFKKLLIPFYYLIK